MNPISAFFVRNIVTVFFLYGLAFFSMGLALTLASRRTSEFRFARAIRPLAAFGVAHGVHEWIEMFQKMATLTSGYTPTASQEAARLAVLVTSFLMMSVFGISLLSSKKTERRRMLFFVAGMTGLWQIRGKNNTTFKEMIRFDIKYSEQQSFLLDTVILLKTPLVILSQLLVNFVKVKGNGSSEEEEITGMVEVM